MVESSGRRILISIPREVGHGRDMIRGIFAYQQFRQDWEMHVHQHKSDQPLQNWSGCILLSGQRKELRVPQVECSNGYEPDGVDSVCEDNLIAGSMAANFFLNQGYEHFLFVGIPHPLYSQQRGEGFRNTLPKPPIETTIWGPGWSDSEGIQKLRRLLESLPKPLAVFAGSDSVGLYLLRIIRETGLLVPEDIAVLGVDNDDLTCLLTHPTLSSVQLNGHQIGREAAKMLSERMDSPGISPRRLRLPPIGIEVRRSTMERAVEHPDVRKALAHIRRFAHKGIGVPDIVSVTGLKRRALEIHVRNATGKTLQEHLRDHRLQRARPLLEQQEYTVQEIAYLCGFQNAARFSVVFREQEGVSPTTYRKQTAS